MCPEITCRDERFSTEVAGIGFLSSVNVLVFFEVALLGKVLPTLVTAEWSLSSVHTYVYCEDVCRGEGFSTDVTTVGFLSSVKALVFSESSR